MRQDYDLTNSADRGYNASMMLRRATVLASLIAYLGVGVCRQVCALDLPIPRPDNAAVASGCSHCHAKTPASSGSSRRFPAPCCVHSAEDASVLLPTQLAILPTPASSVTFVYINAPTAIPDAAAPSALATRAPPGVAPSVLAQALHGPRPPPSLLVVL